jgi:hypothetical protein
MHYSAAAVAYLTAVNKKCEGWLRRQHADLTPARRLSPFKYCSHLNSSSPLAVHQFIITHHLECQMSVIVNVNIDINLPYLAVLTASLKSVDPSFCLLSTWVPPSVQDTLNEAHKAELSAQAGLITTYLDIDSYNFHQRNTDSELLYLHARMHHAKAEVEVYELAIENVPASNFPDSGE